MTSSSELRVCNFTSVDKAKVCTFSKYKSVVVSSSSVKPALISGQGWSVSGRLQVCDEFRESCGVGHSQGEPGRREEGLPEQDADASGEHGSL